MVLFLQGPVLLIHLCFPWFTGSAFAIVPYLVCVSLLHLTAFGIAVCLTCVLRQTVYAGILAVGAILSLIALPEIVPSFSWLSIGSVLFSLNHTEYLDIRAWFIGFYLPFLSVMAAMLVPLALIAWLAVRFDLGRRA